METEKAKRNREILEEMFKIFLPHVRINFIDCTPKKKNRKKNTLK